MEPIDDVQQVGPAQNLLRDALHPLLQVVINVRRDVVLRHAGLLDQDERGRFDTSAAAPSLRPIQLPINEQRDQKMDVAALHHAQIFRYVEALSALLF